MSRRMQAFYAMRLQCSEKRQKKNTLYSGNSTRWPCRHIIFMNNSNNLSPCPVWPPYRTQSLHLLTATVILPSVTQNSKIRTVFQNEVDKCSGDFNADPTTAKFTENQIFPEYSNTCMSRPALNLPLWKLSLTQIIQRFSSYRTVNTLRLNGKWRHPVMAVTQTQTHSVGSRGVCTSETCWYK